MNTKFVIFDLEWTRVYDKSGVKDCILEIGAVRIEGNKTPDTFHRFLKCPYKIKPAISKLTGLSNEMVDIMGVDREEGLREFVEFSKGATLVAHDVQNDIQVLEENLEEFSDIEMENKVLCTLRLSKRVLQLNSYSLDSICKHIDIEIDEKQRHRALYDALLASKIFQHILKFLPKSIDNSRKLEHWQNMEHFIIRHELEKIENIDTSQHYYGFFDGASSGNPGHIGAGIVLANRDGKVISKISKYIGFGTNNEAEYMALILLLQLATKSGIETLTVFGDSKLVVSQVEGAWKVRSHNLKSLYKEALELIEQIPNFSIKWIDRKGNKMADKLAKKGVKQGENITK